VDFEVNASTFSRVRLKVYLARDYIFNDVIVWIHTLKFERSLNIGQDQCLFQHQFERALFLPFVIKVI
jgi:hypothetical protein